MSNRREVFSKVVGFLGAGIVLSTFVVKDVMREQVKELNDTITSAETFYLTQNIDQRDPGANGRIAGSGGENVIPLKQSDS